MTTESIAVETASKAPSKLAFLKSKITQKGLIAGGVITGIIIAGGYTLLSNLRPDLEGLDEDEQKDFENVVAMTEAGSTI